MSNKRWDCFGLAPATRSLTLAPHQSNDGGDHLSLLGGLGDAVGAVAIAIVAAIGNVGIDSWSMKTKVPLRVISNNPSLDSNS